MVLAGYLEASGSLSRAAGVCENHVMPGTILNQSLSWAEALALLEESYRRNAH